MASVIVSLALLASCSGEEEPFNNYIEDPPPEPSVRWTTLASGKSLSGVWIDHDSTAYTVGEEGSAFYSKDGGWVPMPIGSSVDFNDIWGDGNGSLYAVGEDGTVAKYDGSWTTYSTPVSVVHTIPIGLLNAK